MSETLGPWVEVAPHRWERWGADGPWRVVVEHVVRAWHWTVLGEDRCRARGSGLSEYAVVTEAKRDADAAARAHGYVLADDPAPGVVGPADTRPANLKAATKRVAAALDRAMVETAGLKDRTAADVVAVAALILAEARCVSRDGGIG